MAFSVAMRKLSEITFVFKEMARQQKERSERERQRAEQERRKEKEEEDALEQVFILIIRPNYFFQMCFLLLDISGPHCIGRRFPTTQRCTGSSSKPPSTKVLVEAKLKATFYEYGDPENTKVLFTREICN